MSSIGRVHVGMKARSLTVAPQFEGISKVILNVKETSGGEDDEILYYEAGTDTGYTLTLFCPWGTEQMAEDILKSVQGYQYQPVEADGAIIDPAAELGDGVTVKDTYTVLASMRSRFGHKFTADISAPHDEEIDHEYPYKSSSERKVTRKLANLTSELKIQAGEISAKVSKESPDGNTDFGWALKDNSWEIFANSETVLKATKEGLEIMGKITATSGKIGGFEILSDRLSYNKQKWEGSISNGIYIGPSGIQCGSKKNGFRVTNSGALYAKTGHFSGTVEAGNIRYGAGNGGTLNGSAITGGSISAYRLNTAVNNSLGYADFANSVFAGGKKAAYVWVNTVIASDTIQFQQHKLKLGQITFKNASGADALANVVMWEGALENR